LGSIYWQRHWYENTPFPIEFLINAIVKAQSKSDFIMLAGNFNISIGGTLNSPTFEGDKNMVDALEYFLNSIGLKILNLKYGSANCTHFDPHPNTTPKCIDLALVSPELLKYTSLEVFPATEYGHSILSVTVQLPNDGIKDYSPPQMNYQNIRSDLTRSTKWADRIEEKIKNSPQRNNAEDWIIPVLAEVTQQESREMK
jgi:hypothetical protein